MFSNFEFIEWFTHDREDSKRFFAKKNSIQDRN